MEVGNDLLILEPTFRHTYFLIETFSFSIESGSAPLSQRSRRFRGIASRRFA
jgi:hypothetical protein